MPSGEGGRGDGLSMDQYNYFKPELKKEIPMRSEGGGVWGGENTKMFDKILLK